MARKDVKPTVINTYQWVGKDRKGNTIKGESRAPDDKQLKTQLRRQGVITQRIKKKRLGSGKAIKPKDIAIFTRQLATMMKSGVPLLQTFEIVARGNTNPRVSVLIDNIRSAIETGSPLNVAFRKYPQYFNELYCNLVQAGESAGILEGILDRLAMYLEKIEGIKSKIKSALMYPIWVMVVAVLVITGLMLFVIPSFKRVFDSFGAELPAPTLFVIAMSDFFTKYWWMVFGILFLGIFLFLRAYKSSSALRGLIDRISLRLPVFGGLIEKSIVARWTRTLSTMFAAGVPLVESLRSVGGAAGNVVYTEATEQIRTSVATGTGLTMAMSTTGVFPQMVLQMTAIGEESGTLDQMLSRAADFYEAEVDEMVAGLSSLLEPVIIVFLGGLIGGIVVAMYLPIFKLGDAV